MRSDVSMKWADVVMQRIMGEVAVLFHAKITYDGLTWVNYKEKKNFFKIKA